MVSLRQKFNNVIPPFNEFVSKLTFYTLLFLKGTKALYRQLQFGNTKDPLG